MKEIPRREESNQNEDWSYVDNLFKKQKEEERSRMTPQELEEDDKRVAERESIKRPETEDEKVNRSQRIEQLIADMKKRTAEDIKKLNEMAEVEDRERREQFKKKYGHYPK